MTEQDWLVSNQAHAMVDAIRDRLTERKALLFSVECVRRVRHLSSVTNLSAILDATEEFAEGRITYDEWQERVNPVGRYDGFDANAVGPLDTARVFVNQAVANLCIRNVEEGGTESFHAAAAIQIAEGPRAPNPEWHPEWARQADLLRCIVGNPFRAAALDDACRTSTVLALARGIYEDRAFDRLPILADALQDGGCEDEAVLTHCRGDGPHARGCWVVDLIIGKC